MLNTQSTGSFPIFPTNIIVKMWGSSLSADCFPCRWINSINNKPFGILIWLLLAGVVFFLPFLALLGSGCSFRGTSYEWGYDYDGGCATVPTSCSTYLSAVSWGPNNTAYHSISLFVLFLIGLFNILLLIAVRKYCCKFDQCKLEIIFKIAIALALALFFFFFANAAFFCLGRIGPAIFFAILAFIVVLYLFFAILVHFGIISFFFWLFVPFALWIFFYVALLLDVAVGH